MNEALHNYLNHLKSSSNTNTDNIPKSMKVLVAAMFLPEPDQILIPDYDAIDKRSAVNRNIKARVIT